MTHENALGRAFDIAVDVWLVLLCCGALAGCGACTLYQRHTSDPADPAPFYLVEVCHEGTPQQTTTLVCTSKTRLPTGSAKCR